MVGFKIENKFDNMSWFITTNSWFGKSHQESSRSSSDEDGFDKSSIYSSQSLKEDIAGTEKYSSKYFWSYEHQALLEENTS